MVARLSKKSTLESDLRFDVLPNATRRAFERCREFSFLKKEGWYLAGGTALALQVGHRQSVDLDFFLPKKGFSERRVESRLLASGGWTTSFLDSGTLYGALEGAKMSFIAYPFFRPQKYRVLAGSIAIIAPSDIAVMKIIAISQRGKKRDFADLFWLCHNGEHLSDILHRVVLQYPQEHNIPHILKSITYFEDAEADPMPTLFFTTTWTEIKAYFRREVPRITRELLHLS